MSDMDEKFIQERLAHEKSEAELFRQLQQLKQENEELKKEIELAKVMLATPDYGYTTKNKPITQIIDEFMDDNLLDSQDDDGYREPMFYQIQSIFEQLESTEAKLEKVKEVERNINMNIYKNEPISIQEFETLKEQGKLDKDTFYLVMDKTDYTLDATRKWCSLSNAIIKKYKEMVDNNDYWHAISELNAIKDFLVENGYFKNKEFEDWGE